VDRGKGQIIELRLNRAEEMFALAQTDLFSEYRNFLTGAEYCISLLRSQRTRGPVRLELSLPPSEVGDDLGDRISMALRRYCDQRISYNQRERRAVRLGGLWSLWVGVPVVVIGYLLVIFTGNLVGSTGNTNLAFATTGWVLVWVGIWWPLDMFFFSPLAYGRENRVLRQLRDAEISVLTWQPAMGRARRTGGGQPQGLPARARPPAERHRRIKQLQRRVAARRDQGGPRRPDGLDLPALFSVAASLGGQPARREEPALACRAALQRQRDVPVSQRRQRDPGSLAAQRRDRSCHDRDDTLAPPEQLFHGHAQRARQCEGDPQRRVVLARLPQRDGLPRHSGHIR
jgi:hypothetical protein